MIMWMNETDCVAHVMELQLGNDCGDSRYLFIGMFRCIDSSWMDM
jgi:hypothetical protein